ncbi:hypothetical protein B0H13DRAFT_2055779 [Mycena leptocephala]|nr:hypothetical protein B0H13DRAFT_2055779 [Mycena leptocephala]
MSDVEKIRGLQHSPLQYLFEPISRWFHARHPQRPSAYEETANGSPLHAQTEDSSAKFWSVYNSEAERYDSALMESWKADMEGMLIFSGLFSASLTAFIIESYKNLVPDTGNMTVALLSQVSQQLSAQSDGSNFTVSPPPPFEAPISSLVCNGLWFVSLGLSLTCALLATLVEQWARQFMHYTEIRPSPARRARVFSRFGIHAIVDLIPLLLHLGLILFLAGLAVFLVPINSIMAGIVASILVVFVTFYVVITILPIISLDCPYRTPVSGILWRLVQYISMLFNHPFIGRSLTDAVLTAAMQRRDIRDERAVLWTLESLTDNTELLPFVEATHEIIDGPTGLRRVDDHLFNLVLSPTADAHTSLPWRILSLLWSAETLPVDDPLRARRQNAGLRALWALGIVASRISRARAKAVYRIDHASLHRLSIPVAHRIALDSVMIYVDLKSIQARLEDIGTMLSNRDLSVPRERRRVVRILRSGREFEAARRELEKLHTASGFNWPYQFSRIAIRLVASAFRERVAPYRLHATCEEILPHVFASLFEGAPEELWHSLHPLLTFVPTIYWYLAHRAGGVNMDAVFAACSLETWHGQFYALVALCLWSKRFTTALDCESVLVAVQGSTSTLRIPHLKARRTEPEWSAHTPGHSHDIQEIASHLLLQDTPGAVAEDETSSISPMETNARLVNQLSERYAAEFTIFSPEATLTYLRREWTPFLTESMSTSTQLEFAQAVLRLALQSIVSSLWEDLDPDGKLAEKFTDQQRLGRFCLPNAVPPSPLVGRRPGRAFSFAESFVAGGPPQVAGMSPLASPVERGQDTHV